MRSDTGSGKARDEMERREIVHNAYAVVGQLSKGYDGMMRCQSARACSRCRITRR